MRIGTVLIVSDSGATVLIDDLNIRLKCQIITNITVKPKDSVLVELLPGGLSGIIIGVM